MPPTLCQVSEKILGAVSEINSRHSNERRTNKGDIIEPVAFAGSIISEGQTDRQKDKGKFLKSIPSLPACEIKTTLHLFPETFD